MEALYQSYSPDQVRFFSCDFWQGNQAQCTAYQNNAGTSFPVLMNAHVLGAPDQYNCSYHYAFVIDGDGLVAYRGSVNIPALELVLDDAVARLDAQTAVGDVPGAEVLLGAAYPNPFNPATNLPFTVPERAGSSSVRVDILDLRGQVVRTVLNETRAPGAHVVTFDGRSDDGSLLPSGTYLARLRVAGVENTRMIALVK